MSKFVVVVFDEESKAYDGSRALNELHNEGSLSLYGVGVIAKDQEGKVEIKQAQEEGPIGTALGMLTGGLIGALAGPAGIVIGAASGSLLGSIGDLNNAGVSLDFAEIVSARMESGTAAVVAELDEYWTTPLDTRMDALGGTVYRRNRADFEDAQWQQEVNAWKEELEELRSEFETSAEDSKAKLLAKADEIKHKLKDAQDKGHKKIEQLEAESKAKIDKLEKQISDAKDDARQKMDQRKEELRADYERRIATLKKAGELIKESLSS
jgi:uncharacterized membrane protein